jgi:hypothetical protein
MLKSQVGQGIYQTFLKFLPLFMEYVEKRRFITPNFSDFIIKGYS